MPELIAQRALEPLAYEQLDEPEARDQRGDTEDGAERSSHACLLRRARQRHAHGGSGAGLAIDANLAAGALHSPRLLARFVKQQGSKMPPGPKFFDQDGRLSNLLRAALKTKDLPILPITLWLGPGRTVRQALTGTISDRASEVMESTERVMRSIKFLREGMKHLPKEEEWDTFTRIGPCRCPCMCN